MKKLLNKCPICGGKLLYADLCQYTNYYVIGKRGMTLKSKKYKSDNGSMEASFIVCENEDFITDCELTVTTPCDSNIEIYQEKGAFYYDEV